MGECDSCESKGSCSTEEKAACGSDNNPLNDIKNVIAVMSGKGGVGKSTVSVLLAKELASRGYKVGILDADITGPSIPRMLGIQDERMTSNGDKMVPAMTVDGIKAVSLNLLLDDENKPVIWRGPIITNTIKQFWKDVLWDELDYMIIDLPPGTGDVALTIMQSFPIDGVVMVSVPQDMVSMIVSKALTMAEMLKMNVIGIVENMSYIMCPDCKTKIDIFASSNTDRYVGSCGTEILGTLPMSISLCRFTERGLIVDDAVVAQEFRQIATKVEKGVKDYKTAHAHHHDEEEGCGCGCGGH